MDRQAIVDGVSKVFAENLGMKDVSEATRLFQDLELDSIQQLTLVVELENHFRIRFDDADEAGIETVGDVVNLLAKRLEAP